MADRSKIPWTDASWNPITGCDPISEGCVHCYARRQHERFQKTPFWEIVVHRKRMDMPRHWRKPRRVFVCSQGDLFHPDVPHQARQNVMATMTMCPQHTFQLLTKRAAWMHDWYVGPGHELRASAKLDNVWLGVTAENQRRLNERMPYLATTPAALRFVSLEPLLGPVNLEEWLDYLGWVIIGAESGPRRRHCQTEWVRDLVKQCKEANVPVFVKQLHVYGRLSKDPEQWDPDLRVHEFPGGTHGRSLPR